MDIIDPTLQSSVKRAEMDATSLKASYGYILLVIGIVFLIGVGFAIYSARLDTRPDKSIEINPNLREPSTTGSTRQAPISETL